MKPAAIVATLALHLAAFGASWQFLGVPARNDFRALEVVLLSTPGSGPAASPAAPDAAKSAARQQMAAVAPAAQHATNTSSATALPGAGMARAGAVAADGGADDGGGNGRGSGNGGAANASSVAGGSTPVSLPADYLVSNRKPEYPLLARQNDEQGTVVLRVLVTEDGRAGKVQLAQSSGYPLLDQSAQSAVQFWRFRPATRNSQPVAEWYRLAIPFKLHS
ncbi:MAG: hypothetical protein H6R01_1710 [Burkholderiaceae bacterium]|nr:hypothetical protein [Burkholderiaceae bacterium]